MYITQAILFLSLFELDSETYCLISILHELSSDILCVCVCDC